MRNLRYSVEAFEGSLKSALDGSTSNSKAKFQGVAPPCTSFSGGLEPLSGDTEPRASASGLLGDRVLSSWYWINKAIVLDDHLSFICSGSYSKLDLRGIPI